MPRKSSLLTYSKIDFIAVITDQWNRYNYKEIDSLIPLLIMLNYLIWGFVMETNDFLQFNLIAGYQLIRKHAISEQ